jgi:hypothetical protein
VIHTDRLKFPKEKLLFFVVNNWGKGASKAYGASEDIREAERFRALMRVEHPEENICIRVGRVLRHGAHYL